AEAIPKARANSRGGVVHVGIALKPSAARGRLSAELRGAWNFKPYRGKPAVRDFRGAAGDVAMGAGLRPSPKGMEPPPDPTARARVPHPTARRRSAGLTEGNMPTPSRFTRLSTGLGRRATGTLRGRRICRLRNRMLSCEHVRV